MKGSPLIVDNLMVACVATGSGSGSTRIRAYDISAKGQSPTFDLIGAYDMPGHVSTTPYVDGNETIGIVSDQGLLWLFGVGKSSTIGTSQSRGATPFFPLTARADEAEAPDQFRAQKRSTPATSAGSSRLIERLVGL
ncbi:MAG: hypothetical protein QM703_28335 [Gemmatales bacterium]